MLTILNKRSEVVLHLPSSAVITMIGCILLIEAFVFLVPAPIEFPMDDTYVHFVYADNFVSHGKLFFSNVNEKEVGATSPLFVFLLAGFKLLSTPFLVSAKALGMVGVAVVSGVIYSLFRPALKLPFLLLAVIILSISGNLIWFSPKFPASSYLLQIDGLGR